MPGFNVRTARLSRSPVIVFDLGGTRFRAGVLNEDDDVVQLRERPAIGLRTCAAPVPALQRQLVDYVVETAAELASASGVRTAGVSIGAAVNHTTGRVIGSAPLWGSALCDFDLVSQLQRACPGIRWTVLNDVTALATSLVKQVGTTSSDFAAAVTVSSGIAYRTIDLRTGAIPVDPGNGLQGEIGHLPAEAFWHGRRLDARCDCGAERHVAGFSSGPGIFRLIRDDPELADLASLWQGTSLEEGPEAEMRLLEAFAERVRAADEIAESLLDTVTGPLAQVILYQATLNPQVTATVLDGGVVDGFGPAYLRSVLRNLQRFGLYAVSGQDPGYFSQRIRLGRGDGLSALRGAGLRARGTDSEDTQGVAAW